MAEETKAKKKCPGWYHDYFHPHHGTTLARQAAGEFEPVCELDQEQYLWEGARKETTIAEREQHRAQLHAQGG